LTEIRILPNYKNFYIYLLFFSYLKQNTLRLLIYLTYFYQLLNNCSILNQSKSVIFCSWKDFYKVPFKNTMFSAQFHQNDDFLNDLISNLILKNLLLNCYKKCVKTEAQSAQKGKDTKLLKLIYWKTILCQRSTGFKTQKTILSHKLYKKSQNITFALNLTIFSSFLSISHKI